MDIITYLQQQFTNLNGLFHALADDLTEAEWDTLTGILASWKF
ncbi:MAG TPA: hypothetical protein VHP14_10495 [Anaerolineales bacterium]|nr:hypothetical protein [Anaerolineales bacterium]